jgi:hypothetical protein
LYGAVSNLSLKQMEAIENAGHKGYDSSLTGVIECRWKSDCGRCSVESNREKLKNGVFGFLKLNSLGSDEGGRTHERFRLDTYHWAPDKDYDSSRYMDELERVERCLGGYREYKRSEDVDKAIKEYKQRVIARRRKYKPVIKKNIATHAKEFKLNPINKRRYCR